MVAMLVVGINGGGGDDGGSVDCCGAGVWR